jgi:hypothetical protein
MKPICYGHYTASWSQAWLPISYWACTWWYERDGKFILVAENNNHGVRRVTVVEDGKEVGVDEYHSFYERGVGDDVA